MCKKEVISIIFFIIYIVPTIKLTAFPGWNIRRCPNLYT